MEEKEKFPVDFAEHYEKKMWEKSALLFIADQVIVPFAVVFSLKLFAAIIGLFLSLPAKAALDAFFDAEVIRSLLIDIAILIIALKIFKEPLCSALQSLFTEEAEIRKKQFGYLWIIFLMTNVTDMLINPIINRFFVNQNEAILNAEQLTVNPMLYVLFAVIIGPVVEEIVCRFALFRPLYLWNKWAAYLITAVTFGLLHVLPYVIFDGAWEQLVVMLPYCVFGLWLSILYVKTKNLCFPIMLHISNNLIAIMLNYIFPS